MSFPPLHILPPLHPSTHTHTLVLLHGRGSTGPEFAEELLDLTGRTSSPSSSSSLASPLKFRGHVPTFHLVFPSAPTRYSSVFDESFPAWFDVESLTDLERKKGDQVRGLAECVSYLRVVVEEEVRLLGGRRERVWVAGMSMGMAVGLWTVLGLGEGRGVGGFMGMCGWLPFAGDIEGCARGAGAKGDDDAVVRASRFIQEKVGLDDGTMQQTDGLTEARSRSRSLLSTPILLLHGTDDAFVDIALGREAARVLRRIGFNVESKEYSGAENEGHWVKEPEGFDDMVAFITKHALTPTTAASE